MAEPVVATFSIAACDLEAAQWGVATQSKFLAVGSVVPWAEPHVGAIATQAYANPRYGPDGLAAAARRALRRRDRRAADRPPTTAAPTGSSASSTRKDARRTYTGAGVHGLGRRGRRSVLRRAGEHPRRRGDGGGARDDVHRDRRTPAGGAADPVPRRRAGGRRRPARPAVGGAARRRARRRLRAPERHAGRPARRRPRRRRSPSWRACTTLHSLLFGADAAPRLARRSTTSCAPRCSSGSRRSDTTASSQTRSARGREPRTSRSGSTARADRPVVLGSFEQAMSERVRRSSWRSTTSSA